MLVWRRRVDFTATASSLRIYCVVGSRLVGHLGFVASSAPGSRDWGSSAATSVNLCMSVCAFVDAAARELAKDM